VVTRSKKKALIQRNMYTRKESAITKQSLQLARQNYEKEKTSMPLFKFIAHMYRLEDINVILSKLYLTIVNRGTMTCVFDTFWAERMESLCLRSYISLTFVLSLIELKVHL
jgi:hypothetical protein